MLRRALSSRPRGSRFAPSARKLAVEALEVRDLLTGTTSAGTPGIFIGSGCCDPTVPALNIVATAGNDTINVVGAGAGLIQVFQNNQNCGTFSLANFRCVVIYGLQGNDTINVAASANVAAIVYGGAGNDTITTAALNDVLFGQGGNDFLFSDGGHDVLVGGNGNDVLLGGAGHDLLIGGLGSDFLNGGAGRDLLISGWTDHDTDLNCLCHIHEEWYTTAPTSILLASQHLSGAVVPGLNGNCFLFCSTTAGTAGTVHDDGVIDFVFGGPGPNLFFVGSIDIAPSTLQDIVNIC